MVPGNFPEVVVYFGSQTGTAEKFANELSSDADTLDIENCRVVDFNSFNPEEFVKHKLVIVCIATHYEGDPPDNTKKFYKWLKEIKRDKANPKPFEGMNFTIFGLGDTSYEQYNEMGIQFDKAFEELGGKRLFAMGVGNAEHHTTEDDFEDWRAGLWPKLIEPFEQTQTQEQRERSL